MAVRLKPGNYCVQSPHAHFTGKTKQNATNGTWEGNHSRVGLELGPISLILKNFSLHFNL